MTNTGTDWKTAVVLTDSAVRRLLVWYAVAMDEGATQDADDALSARLHKVLESSATR